MKTLLALVLLTAALPARADFTVTPAKAAGPTLVKYVCADGKVTTIANTATKEIELVLKDFSLNDKLVNGSDKESCQLQTVHGEGISMVKIVLCDVKTDAGSTKLKIGRDNYGGILMLSNLTTGQSAGCERTEE